MSNERRAFLESASRGPDGSSLGPPRLVPVIRGLAIGLLALTLPFAAAGQAVTGKVTDAASGKPLQGVFLILRDGAGKRAGGALTDRDGRFVLRPANAGRYRLTAELIGYASADVAPLDLLLGSTVRSDVALSVAAIRLDGIQVGGERRCGRGLGRGVETARLWEEARKALEVTRWGQATRQMRFVMAEHRSELDAATLAVRKQEEHGRAGYYDASPFVSAPAAELERKGYVHETSKGQYTYNGPDADVLLSDLFLDGHCFSVVRGPSDERELIGLSFRPVRGRHLPDIEGVLWLDSRSANLRRIDFTYVNLPLGLNRLDNVGGRVEFQRLPSGMWIVNRWYIRMPLDFRTSGVAPARRELATLIEEGAEVQEAFSRNAREACRRLGWADPRGSDPVLVYGRVLQADRDTPVPGAMLRVMEGGAEHRVRADSAGAFRFCFAARSEGVRLAAVGQADATTPFSALDPLSPDLAEPGFVALDLVLKGSGRVR